MTDTLKRIIWAGATRRDMRNLPDDARREGGHELELVQRGLAPTDWKPMPQIGAGVREIRVHTQLEHRVIYTAHFAEAIYVLHVFEKRTQKTPKAVLELARSRLSEIKAARATRG